MSCTIQDYAKKYDLETLDYSLDYSDELSETDPLDTIVASSWASTSGSLTIVDDTLFGSTTTTVWVSGGGKNGTLHRLTNTATTAGGRILVRQLIVKMVNKVAYVEEEEVVIPTD